MTWLSFALIGMTIWSATAIADRYFLLQVKSVRFYLLLPTLLQLPLMALVMLYFPLQDIGSAATYAAIASGVLEAAVLYFLFVAIRSEEVSRVFPLTGLGPILTLIAGWLFLGDSVTSTQALAMGLFMIAGIFLSLTHGGGRIKISKALPPIFIGSFLTSAFMLTLKYSVETDFWTGFFYSRIGFFLAGLVVLFVFAKEIRRQWSALRNTMRAGLIANQTISFSGHVFYFFSLSLASAALVQATLSMQSGIIFLMALMVSVVNPRLLEESTKSRDIIQKVIGIALAITATYLLASA